MNGKNDRERFLQRRIDGWRDRNGRWVTGVTLYLFLTGLSIYALPFSVFNQHAVLVHTAIGVLWIAPFLYYAVGHLVSYWRYPSTHVKFSGYGAALTALACLVSGIALTLEGTVGTRISYVWRDVHIYSTFGLAVLLGAHLGTLWIRAGRLARDSAALRSAVRGHTRTLVGSSLALLLVTAGLALVVRPPQWNNDFPVGYNMAYGEGTTAFSPSLARTASGGAYDARSLSGSASCGTAGCHQEIYREWLPSAHRYASLDAGFQKIQSVMAQQNGADSTRYCGGCHDPISLFSGTKNIGVEDLTSLAGYQEGISCLACHAIKETDISGNADYVMTQPDRYVWELIEGPFAKFLSDFVIRTYPAHHVETLSRRMFKTPEFCAACHKQFIDKEVNQVGWVQLQNQFDNWRASRWHDPDHPERTVECRECHMPLLATFDPASGDEADANRTPDDGMHRSHRFLGGNQFIPVLQKLEGGEQHAADVEKWLRGEIEIPEIAQKWSRGAAVPIELDVPDQVAAGEQADIRVHIINNKVGHDFPTGPLDIIQAWIEVEVTDADGRVVFHSGKKDERNFIETGTFMFKAEPVDRYGNLIDRHNLWEMVGVRFKRSLFPGSEEVASYTFECSGAEAPEQPPELTQELSVKTPQGLTGPLTVAAELKYRKFDQYLLNFAFGEDSGLSSPITVLSSATAQIRLAD